jgi:hypothetical protein
MGLGLAEQHLTYDLHYFHRESWSTHFAWNSNTTVDSSHCTIELNLNLLFFLILVEHPFCLEQLLCCLFEPLYACTWTNLQVTFSGQTHRWSDSTLFLTNEIASKKNQTDPRKPITGFKIDYVGWTDRDGQMDEKSYL